MIAKARAAQAIYMNHFDQDDVDQAVKITTRTIYDHAEELARMAVEETGMGVYEDKVAKNRNKSKGVWWDLKGKKSIGILGIDERTGLIEIAKPIGVVAGVTPMTNPIVTPMSKIAFALKSRNAIIIAPHPKAKRCSAKAVHYIVEALKAVDLPDGMVQIVEEPTLEKTQALMAYCDVTVATGGMPMVKSAYSSGKPSYGVGAGNVQVILDRNIDYALAVGKIVTGRSFDNGIICSGEQSCIYPQEAREEVIAAFRQHHAHAARAHNAHVDAVLRAQRMIAAAALPGEEALPDIAQGDGRQGVDAHRGKAVPQPDVVGRYPQAGYGPVRAAAHHVGQHQPQIHRSIGVAPDVGVDPHGEAGQEYAAHQHHAVEGLIVEGEPVGHQGDHGYVYKYK